MYIWHMPPLWNWLVSYLETWELSQIGDSPRAVQAETLSAIPPTPLEQLTLVLPIQSWHLNPSATHRQFAYRCPWYFPEQFAFISTGKRFFWECEADIPIPTIKEIRAAVGKTQRSNIAITAI